MTLPLETELFSASNLENRPLISRQMNKFTSGGKAPSIGRWGLFMESNELFLASPGTDFNSGRVSIGGYLANGKQSNLTVNNYTGMVGIGTTTPTSTLQVNGTITARLASVRSSGTSSQYLMADGSTSSLVSSYANTANMIFS